MPLTHITKAPTRNDKPSFVIDILGANPLQMRGAGRRLRHNVNQQFDDTETFDNPGGEAPSKSPKSFTMEILASHGATGSYNLLLPLVGPDPHPFAYQINADAANSVDNPEYSGLLYVPDIPIIDAGVQEFSRFSIEFKISGIPVVTTDGTPVYDSHA